MQEVCDAMEFTDNCCLAANEASARAIFPHNATLKLYGSLGDDHQMRKITTRNLTTVLLGPF